MRKKIRKYGESFSSKKLIKVESEKNIGLFFSSLFYLLRDISFLGIPYFTMKVKYFNIKSVGQEKEGKSY